MSWAAPSLVILRILEVQRAKVVPAPSGKSKDRDLLSALLPAVVVAAERDVEEGRTASLSSPSHRTMSCRSAHLLAPGLRWLARTSPPLETWLVPDPKAEAPISAPSPPAATPWPRALEASAPPGSPPGCRLLPCLPAPRRPSPRSHSRCPALPASPSLVSRVSLTPLVLNCLPCQSQRRAGEGHSDLRPVPAPAAGPQCHAGTARPQAGPPQPPCCRNLRGPDLRPPPRPGDVLLRFPAHCTLCLALLPSRLWRRPGGQARAPAEPSPEWVAVGVVAAGDPAV